MASTLCGVSSEHSQELEEVQPLMALNLHFISMGIAVAKPRCKQTVIEFLGSRN
jgi:hypothetical protein